MAILKVFCFWFSVRLGNIIIGVASMIQSSIWLMITIIALGNVEELKEVLQNSAETISITNKFFLSIVNNPEPYVIAIAVFFCLFLLSSILLNIAAFKCIYQLIFPFILFDSVYLIFLLMQLTIFMMYFKATGFGLGFLILYSNIGVFIIIYLVYLWLTVVSFLQILRELQSRITNQITLGNIYQNSRKNILVEYSNKYNGLKF